MSFVALDLVPLLAAMLAPPGLRADRQPAAAVAAEPAGRCCQPCGAAGGGCLPSCSPAAGRPGRCWPAPYWPPSPPRFSSGLIVRAARLPPQAAMGIVFTGFFALGVVLLEAGVGRRVHLDLDHVLLGQLEALIWPAAQGWESRAGSGRPGRPAARPAADRRPWRRWWCCWSWPCGRSCGCLCFDPDFAAVAGFAPRGLSVLLLAVLALACVAAFWAVGVVLAIAALVVPPTAWRGCWPALPGADPAVGRGGAADGSGRGAAGGRPSRPVRLAVRSVGRRHGGGGGRGVVAAAMVFRRRCTKAVDRPAALPPLLRG